MQNQTLLLPSSWASFHPHCPPVSLLPDSPAHVCHLLGHKLAPSSGLGSRWSLPQPPDQESRGKVLSSLLGTDGSNPIHSAKFLEGRGHVLTTFGWKGLPKPQNRADTTEGTSARSERYFLMGAGGSGSSGKNRLYFLSQGTKGRGSQPGLRARLFPRILRGWDQKFPLIQRF